MITNSTRRNSRLAVNAIGAALAFFWAWGSARADVSWKFGLCMALFAYCVTKFANDMNHKG
jgi:hypothetical protein